MSSTVDFFLGFRVGNLDGKVSIRQSYCIKSCSSVCCKSGILNILGIFGLSNV